MPKRRRGLLIFVSLLGGVFVLAQLFRPELSNPPVTADLSAPAPVKAILRRSCYDCHSNETRLPWFDRIVPAYWLVVRDVTEGRKRLNFSDIGKLPAPKRSAVLFESVNHVLLGAMPPRPYVAIHPEAKVSDGDLITLKSYLKTLAVAPKPPTASVPAPVPAPVPPAPNGIPFPTDYGSWQPISGSERFDNGTIRVILGNAAATQAIRDHRIAPWPDGAALAKVAWTASADPDGGARAGDFWQVEFMFKDRQRYASSIGWGFARWRGADLRPYGKDASFAQECVGCHAPLKDSDFVFTRPIQRGPEASALTNGEAALPHTRAFDLLGGRVLGLAVDSGRATLSMLQGNDIAAKHASTRGSEPYPPGSILALVTWAAADDARWFGARVPGAAASVDILTRDGEAWSHESFARGSAALLARLPSGDPARMADMLGRKAVAMVGTEP